MKCPKYIRDKIYQRARYAIKFTDLDREISDWIDKHNIDSEYALCGYVETLVGGFSAAEECINDIEGA